MACGKLRVEGAAQRNPSTGTATPLPDSTRTNVHLCNNNKDIIYDVEKSHNIVEVPVFLFRFVYPHQ